MSTIENINTDLTHIENPIRQIPRLDKWEDIPFPSIYDKEFSSRWSLKDRQKFDESIRKRVIEYRKEPPTEKLMSHSYVEQYLPFKSSQEFNDSHTSEDGSIQFGKILEAIDDVAGVISGRHIECMKVNDIFVNLTVGIEQIYLNMPDSIEDYKLSGCVAYTKGTLLVVVLSLEMVKHENITMDTRILRPIVVPGLGAQNQNTVAIFEATFMQFNTLIGKPCKVGQLKCTTLSEKLLFDRTEKKIAAQQNNNQIQQKLALCTQENIISNCILNTEQDQGSDVLGSVAISDTQVESHGITTPQDRNAHGTTFGGYLVHGGYKVACSAATHFLQSTAFKLVNMNDICFILPIRTGEHIKTSAQVIYSDSRSNKGFVVRVRIETLNIKTMKYKLAILMNTVFAPIDQSTPLKTLQPKSNESDLWKQGQHIFNQTYNVDLSYPYKSNQLGPRSHKL
ncbi:hypothetical protein J3Q64DRAFT_1860706 [Phycomyces blakesleeanus]|uniref:HotDog ACOT-type domain-containing protein n=2 Tax=Phycomyces blakesleeanus TaxID=4837 RepID=A0A163DU56_PHYB8|nr:hypothetical protein PHYBLDRAFT_168793 [Phycomyces blakesleeanus NRRL 1555(-)]OAD73440.1 hypothetical protein PHYBLDRAFT_168793 [Phycomyces blakesleeanus NRRL 1555(-)]|eukprot:XP_018291480.1 hypothetical protein PHYBLDRAFT_168793 [Phycomyces blakesleeanus NRRL 1555(-)]